MSIEQITKSAVQSQYLAALAMLREVVERCPPALWTSEPYPNRTWQVAYHALFYTHLYLQPSAEHFKAWERHRADYEFLGPLPWPPHRKPEIGEPYTPADVLDFWAFCVEDVRAQVPNLELNAPSGFDWLNFNKLELQLYNIRHLQHHTGELGDRLGAAGVKLSWVGSG